MLIVCTSSFGGLSSLYPEGGKVNKGICRSLCASRLVSPLAPITCQGEAHVARLTARALWGVPTDFRTRNPPFTRTFIALEKIPVTSICFTFDNKVLIVSANRCLSVVLSYSNDILTFNRYSHKRFAWKPSRYSKKTQVVPGNGPEKRKALKSQPNVYQSIN